MKPQHAKVSIEELRTNLARATIDSERLTAFATLIFHDDACWSDLLAGLDASSPIAQTAALYLHAQLNAPHRGSPILDKTTWLTLLAESGQSPSDKVTPNSTPAQPSLWQKIRRAIIRRA